jgi:hypothetical protein
MDELFESSKFELYDIYKLVLSEFTKQKSEEARPYSAKDGTNLGGFPELFSGIRGPVDLQILAHFTYDNIYEIEWGNREVCQLWIKSTGEDIEFKVT